MANQMIALQARAPQTDILGPATRQAAQMVNMMSQQAAAERQAAAQQQQADIAQAQEARAAAIAKPQLAKAESEAASEQMKAVSAFLDLSVEGLAQARNPDQAARVGAWLKQQFPDNWAQQSVDETLSSMPTDPAQFEAWRKQSLFQSMDAKDQLQQHFQTVTNGAEQWTTATPELAGAPGGLVAEEVAGSRVAAPQGITYVKAADGSIIPMPKEMPGAAAPGLVGGSRGGGGHPALATNPGALKDSAFTRSQPGYAGSKGAFAVFDTPEAGIAAQETLLRDSYVGRGFNTIAKIVNRYAPQGPENSAASVRNYQQYIAQRAGIDVNQPIAPAQIPAVAQAMREFETGQRPGGTIQMGKPIPGTAKPGGAATTEDERKIASNVRNMVSSARELAAVIKEDASAMAPGAGEYTAGMIPFVGDEAALWAQSGSRQRFNSAMEKMLAAVTYINTGAGVSETQMKSYRKSYFPTTQDTARTRQQKMLGLIQFVQDAKVRAGNAWTPELDTVLASLRKTFGTAATYGSKPAAQTGGGGGFRVTKVAD